MQAMKAMQLIGVALAVLSSVPLWAADDSPLETLRADSEIAKSIEQLDSSLFAERNQASRKLEDAGKSAIGPLTDAALGGSREVTLRSLDILKKHFNSSDEQLKAAAREALQTIADSKHDIAAHRADEILNPKPAQAMNAIPGIQIMPGQIKIQINAIAGAQARRIQINNGVKNIEAEENGRKVKISEDPVKGIEMQVTEKKDGKEVTQKYTAKSAEELKKQHPEAYKLYDKYAKQGAGGIQMQAIQIRPAIPLRAPAKNPAPARDAQRKAAASMLQHAKQIIASSSQQLEQLKADAEDKDKLEESIKRLKGIQESLDEEHAKLSGG